MYNNAMDHGTERIIDKIYSLIQIKALITLGLYRI